jgi:hypothetical protein
MAYLHWMGRVEWEAKGKPRDRLKRNFTFDHSALSRQYLESYAANYTSMLNMVQSIYPQVGWGAAAGATARPASAVASASALPVLALLSGVGVGNMADPLPLLLSPPCRRSS